MEIKPTYKEITNYLRNELGITREYIGEVVQKSIANTIKQLIEEHGRETNINSIIQQTVRALVVDGSTTSWNASSTKERFATAVMNEVQKHAGKVLLQGFDIQFKVKAKDQEVNIVS